MTNNFEKTNQELNLEEFKPYLRIQIELALRFYGLERNSVTRADAESCIQKWIAYDDNKFSRGISDVLKRDSKLLELYEENPEEALEKIEKLIYQGVEKVA